MSDSTYNIERIEKYFDNELTDRERDEFIENLKTDPELKRLYDQERVLLDAVRLNVIDRNLKFIKDVESSLPEPVLVKRTEPWKYYAAVAAGVALLIVASVFMLNQPKTTDELYAEYFTPYPNLFEPAVRGNQPSRAEAFRAYDNGDYGKAALMFEEMLSDKSDPAILLLLGNANLANGELNKATNNFQDLLNNYDELDTQAKWYLGLCYLKSGDLESAKTIWQELGATDASYSEKARQLLRETD